MGNNQPNRLFKATIATALMTGAVVATGPAVTKAETKTFTDVRDIPTHHFYEAVMKYTAAGMMNGYADGTFKPGQNITRQDAAKLLALVLDLDLEKTDNPNFKDVSKNHPYYKYIAALVEEGIISGYEDNTFRPNDSLTRAQMAKILVLGFELDEMKNVRLPFSDINAKQWHIEFVRSLYGHEITTGTTPTTFSPNAHVTRGQMASFVLRGEAFITPKVDENQVAVDAAVALLKTGTVNVARGPLASDETKAAAVNKYAASLMTDKGITVKASEGKTAGAYIITLSKGEAKVEKSIEVKFDYAADDRFVTDVKAVNAKQVEIHFTTPVAKSSVLDATNNVKNIAFTMVSGSTVNPGTLTGALSEDGKVLTITANWIFDGEYAFKATSAITSAKGEKFEDHTSILKAVDKTGPKYVSGSATAKTATNTFHVNFDEPVNAAGVIAYVNDQPATVANSSTNPNELIITVNKAVAAGTTAKVRLLNVKDYKNNFAEPNPVNVDITISADTVAPTVTNVKVLGENRIEVTYDKDMNLASFVNHARLVHSNGQIIPLTATAGQNSKTVILTGSGIFYNDKYDAVLFIDSDVKDTVGNTAKTYSTTVTMVKDKTAPLLETVEYKGGKIVTSFSKEVVLNGNQTIQAINQKTGVSTPIFVNSSNVAIVNNTLTISQSLPNGDYMLRVPANTVVDKSSARNANQLATVLFTVTNEASYDVVRPYVSGIASTPSQPGTLPGTEQTVTYTAIDADSGIDLTTVQDVNNYTLDGRPLPVGSYVATTFSGPADRATTVSVTVHIPSALINETKIVPFTVNNIRDNAGNILAVPGFGNVTMVSGLSPTLTSARVVGNNGLLFTFSEVVQNVDTKDFQLIINNHRVPTSALNRIEPNMSVSDTYSTTVMASVAKDVIYNGVANQDVVYIDTDYSNGYTIGDLVLEVLPVNNNYPVGKHNWTVNLRSNKINDLRIQLVADSDSNSAVRNLQNNLAHFNTEITVSR